MIRQVGSLLALVALCGAATQAVPGVAVGKRGLVADGRRLVIRGVGYRNGGVTPCLYARDLPLIAASGANTVRTLALIPAGDRHFSAILESTGLYWLADFPLDPYQNPADSILAQRERILSDFRAYAERVGGNRRLLAVVFGSGVAADYGLKFAGSPDEFYELAADAARVLRETGSHALFTIAVDDPAELGRSVPGLDFWSLNGGVRPLLDAALKTATLPLLVSSFGGEIQDENVEAATAADAAVALAERNPVLGGVWREFASAGPGGLVRRTQGVQEGFDNLQPRPVFYRLATVWGGTYPSGWAEPAAPKLDRVENETAASAGALVRIAGSNLMPQGAPYRDESWPFSLGATCVCVGSVPARLSALSPNVLTVQIPTGTEPGERSVVFYRAGRASNTLPVRIRISADTLAGPLLDAD